MPDTPPQTVTLKEFLESKIISVEANIRAAYPSRAELLALLKDIDRRLTDLEISKAQLAGKADQSVVTITMVVAFISIGLTILGFFLK